MPPPRRSLLAALVLLPVALLARGPAATATLRSPATAAPESTEIVDPEPGGENCACVSGFGACQHYLAVPYGFTAEPCYCDKCRKGTPHSGDEVPKGMNPLCFHSPRVACYLKRHAVAWHISCSECLKNDKCCPVTRSAFCPDCGLETENPPFAKDDMGRPAKETVQKRLAAEAKLTDENDLILLYNRHFYIVCNVRGAKVRMKSGFREFTAHEYAHLMLERAEYARKEFVENFGERFVLKTPVAIFLTERQSTAERIQTAYMGSPKTNQLYGGTSSANFVGGMCANGFCLSGEKYRPDEALHFAMRHMIGHALLSIWVVADGNNRTLPRWLFEGVGHWLSRYQERFKDEATYCSDEGKPLQGSGKDWDADCTKMASRPRLDSIEKLFGKTALVQLTLEDDQRAWSYLDLCLKEWREPFVKMLADLRNGKEVRDSFMQHLQCTPEIFDERWRKRVTGKRKSMSPKSDEDELAQNDTPTARERRALRSEEDLPALAARIRALGTVDDPETVNVLCDLYARNSDLVRESVSVSLLKMKAPACRERVATYGLVHASGIVRAYAARICGKMAIKSALPELRTIVAGDKHWLARAEAAIACGTMNDVEALDSIAKAAASDPAAKAQLAAMDALALLGDASVPAIPVIAAHLSAPQWQLRVAAAQSLGDIGSMQGVEPLVARMELETGHVREEIHDALKQICRLDMGAYAADWRKWWDRVKAQTKGLPERPKKPPEPKPDQRYGTNFGPTYYGIQIYSNRVGFVLDTSESMDSKFEPDPKIASSLSRTYAGSSKLEICKEEITQTLSKLDPRAHFSIITFNTKILSFKREPIAASPDNVAAATSWLRNLPAAGETNYYGGLRAALNLDEGIDLSPDFRDTPDTLTFLTDGVPTDGEITDADTLLEWYTTLNRYARIRTHVIAFGSNGVDLVVLKNMADRNRGRFVHVAEKE
jgi:HEAT repeat protein